MSIPTQLLGCDLPDLEAFFRQLGERPFRAKQLMQWVFKRGAVSFEAMTSLPRELRARLAESAVLDVPRAVSEQRSLDGTAKLLLELRDGERIETVLIPDGDRLTQCVSSQVGCGMGCAFCRTSSGGLRRNLTAAEIVGQVVLGQIQAGEGRRVTNVVFMGMGEPLHNLDAVVRAFRVLSSDHGLNITKRRLTVSTCGVVDAMKRVPADLLSSLAVSLNATTDEVRDRIMPVNRRYPIARLLGALRELPLPPRARFTIEYVLLGDLNDSAEDARRLARLLSDVRCKVNLIPYNPGGAREFKIPSPERVAAFQRHLLEKNFTAVLRRSRGQDIHAACGQLRAESVEDTAGPVSEGPLAAPLDPPCQCPDRTLGCSAPATQVRLWPPPPFAPASRETASFTGDRSGDLMKYPSAPRSKASSL
jgi:23S rRNA (adenine2503-C2)-methyltransferase